MLCVFCLIVLWGFSLVTSYSGVIVFFIYIWLVRGRGVVFRHYYKSIAKCAGKDYRDGAVVPFE